MASASTLAGVRMVGGHALYGLGGTNCPAMHNRVRLIYAILPHLKSDSESKGGPKTREKP